MGTSMILRMAAAGLAGLLAGCGALAWAVSVVSSGTDTGVPVLAALVMWAAGIATTAFGAGGVAFYGIGLAKLCWSDMRERLEANRR